jgi:hypothetical protein
MDEGRKAIIHRGVGAYLRCPVSTSVHFSPRNEGSSEYIYVCVKGKRESLSPNFKIFQDPRHQFHGIGRLVSETLYLLTTTLALLHMRAKLIPWKFVHSLKVKKFGIWRTTYVCYVTLSLTPMPNSENIQNSS